MIVIYFLSYIETRLMYQSCPNYQLCIVTLLISANACIQVAISLANGKGKNLVLERWTSYYAYINSETLLHLDLYIYVQIFADKMN